MAGTRRMIAVIFEVELTEGGRDGLFADYRLRVATVSRDYGMSAREEAPADSRQRHQTVQSDERDSR